jgi:hypothetical protein
MSHLHDWRNAPEGLVQEYIDCMRTGDTGRGRQIQEKVHAKNRQAKAKDPGAIARLMGFFKPRKESLPEKPMREIEEKDSDDPEKV